MNPKRITFYATHVCPYCIMAEQLLKSLDVSANQIDKIYIDENPTARQEMMQITKRRTVPQIFIGLTQVGGYDDLALLHKKQLLQPLLNSLSSNPNSTGDIIKS